jgi:hypothetical protein
MDGRGYELSDLEDAINHMDVTTLKPFRQSACQDPVAQQILKLTKGLTSEGSSSSAPSTRPNQNRSRYPPRKEGYASELRPAKGKGKRRSFPPNQHRTPPDQSKLDQIANFLPHKDGKVDMEQYGKYKEGGLRQKLHEAIRALSAFAAWQPGIFVQLAPSLPSHGRLILILAKQHFGGLS